MTIERSIEMPKIERECVKRANTCDRDCANCKLVQDDKELISMYNFVIKYLELEEDRVR